MSVDGSAQRIICKQHYYVLFGAFLFWFGFNYHFLWFLGIIATALFFYLVATSTSLQNAIWVSFVLGFAKSVSGVAWILDSNLLTRNIASSSAEETGIQMAYLFVCGVIMSTGLLSSGVILYFLKNRAIAYYVSAPAVVVLGETIGSAITAFVTVGPGVTNLPLYSFSFLANLITVTNPFIILAWFGGAYSVSLGLASLAVIVSLLYQKYRMRLQSPTELLIVVYMTVFLLTCVVSYVVVVNRVDSLSTQNRIFAVGTNWERIDSHLRQGELRGLIDAYTQYEQPPDYIVFPEGSNLSTEGTDWLAAPSSADTTIVENSSIQVFESSRVQNESGDTVLRGYMYQANNHAYTATDKEHLVPQGEYLSHFVRYLFSFILPSQQVETIAQQLQYTSGVRQGYYSTGHEHPIVLFCFESMVPTALWARRVQFDDANRPEWVIHPVSHGWFDDTRLLARQTDALVMMQAVWNNLSVLQVGNNADTKLFRPNGRIQTGRTIERGWFWVTYEFLLS